MDTVAVTQLYDYEGAVRECGDKVTVFDQWIISGEIYFDKWALFISCKANQGPELIAQILPFLEQLRCPYRIIKDQIRHFQLNAGAFGVSEVGKVISVYGLNDKALEYLVESLNVLGDFIGPEVYNAIRITPFLYVSKTVVVKDGLGGEYVDFVEPEIGELAIRNVKLKRKKRKRVLGKYYIPVMLISKSAKGEIFKAINIKRFAFNWCLVKQGMSHAIDDLYDRSMKDRLIWQKDTLNDLKGIIPIPRVLDYFEDKDAYLVMEFIEGQVFYDKVMMLKGNEDWNALTGDRKRKLFTYFLEIIRLIKKLHAKGYIHRDITDRNFIVKPNDEIYIIDFELSYNILRSAPNPPFILGTYGYAAPEQLKMEQPSVKEDVYSLAALFVFIITGQLPISVVTEDLVLNRQRISIAFDNQSLVDHICLCLSPITQDRPDIQQLESAILLYLNSIAL